MAIRLDEFKARLLSNPEMKFAYDAPAAEFERSAKSEDREKKSPPKKSSNREPRHL